MPIKILLADKSITIQKVVEMLFSGKEYEVLCVSDGETALAEARRVPPDVVLADIDLPRMDGYTFSARLKQLPALAQTPVILMMSRDDVFDEARAKQASIVDHIAKPFESQDLIGKVKKAAAGAPVRPAAAAAKPQTPPRPAAAPAPPVSAAKPQPSKQAPTDIFDIIDDAPSHADLKRGAAPAGDEAVYEVEPVVEVEESLVPEAAKALPVGVKAVEEMREGLGLGRQPATPEPDIVSFESLDMAAKSAGEYTPPKRSQEDRVAREWKPPVAAASGPPRQGVSEGELQTMAAGIVSKLAREMLGNVQGGAPRVPEETVRAAVEESAANIVREIAREVIEKVAWEVVPDLAATMIREEIERLKAET